MGLLLLDTLLLHVAVLCTCSKVLYISVLLITKSFLFAGVFN